MCVKAGHRCILVSASPHVCGFAGPRKPQRSWAVEEARGGPPDALAAASPTPWLPENCKPVCSLDYLLLSWRSTLRLL
jgi:hypothetical protein